MASSILRKIAQREEEEKDQRSYQILQTAYIQTNTNKHKPANPDLISGDYIDPSLYREAAKKMFFPKLVTPPPSAHLGISLSLLFGQLVLGTLSKNT